VADQEPLTRVLTGFACLLVEDYQTSEALDDLVAGVTDVLAIAGAGVSIADRDGLKFAAAGEGVCALERVQEETQAGPSIDAHREGRPVLVADLMEGPGRWPVFSDLAAEMGICAVAGIPMSVNGTKFGALNLYDQARRDWSADDVSVARLLADTASGYVANASRLTKARHTAEQLQAALDSRVVIEQAKGVLAGERNISVAAAFELLRSHARSHNASLHSVADAVVNLRLRP